MTVRELSSEQLDELKQNHLTRKMDEAGESPSYGELVEASEKISDEEIFDEYDGTEFSPDDFMCSTGQQSREAYIMEGLPGQYLHINANPDEDGTWFDWTPCVWLAYIHDLEQLREIAQFEFSDFKEGYPKFHKVRLTCEVLETVK